MDTISLRRATEFQKEHLVKSLESNAKYAVGSFENGDVCRFWTELSKELNELGCDKSALEWVSVWSYLISRTQAKWHKIARFHQHRVGTAPTPLNTMESRILNIINKARLRMRVNVKVGHRHDVPKKMEEKINDTPPGGPGKPNKMVEAAKESISKQNTPAVADNIQNNAAIDSPSESNDRVLIETALSRVCRLCLRSRGTLHLNGPAEGGNTLAEMLSDCYGITLSCMSEVGRSRLACSGCAMGLKVACVFKQQVLLAEQLFKDHYRDGRVNMIPDYGNYKENTLNETEIEDRTVPIPPPYVSTATKRPNYTLNTDATSAKVAKPNGPNIVITHERGNIKITCAPSNNTATNDDKDNDDTTTDDAKNTDVRNYASYNSIIKRDIVFVGNDASNSSIIKKNIDVVGNEFSNSSIIKKNIDVVGNEFSNSSIIKKNIDVVGNEFSNSSIIEKNIDVVGNEFSNRSIIEKNIDVVGNEFSNSSIIEKNIDVVGNEVSNSSIIKKNIDVVGNEFSNSSIIKKNIDVVGNEFSNSSIIKKNIDVVGNEFSNSSIIEKNIDVVGNEFSNRSIIEKNIDVVGNEFSNSSIIEKNIDVVGNEVSNSSIVKKNKDVVGNEVSNTSIIKKNIDVVGNDASNSSIIKKDMRHLINLVKSRNNAKNIDVIRNYESDGSNSMINGNHYEDDIVKTEPEDVPVIDPGFKTNILTSNYDIIYESDGSNDSIADNHYEDDKGKTEPDDVSVIDPGFKTNILTSNFHISYESDGSNDSITDNHYEVDKVKKEPEDVPPIDPGPKTIVSPCYGDTETIKEECKTEVKDEFEHYRTHYTSHNDHDYTDCGSFF